MYRRITATLLLVLCAGLLTSTPVLAASPGPGNATDLGVQTVTVADTPWSTETIDAAGNVGAHVSLARHPQSGSLLISYYDVTNSALKLARQDGSRGTPCGPGNTWSCETVDNAGDVGQYSSLALDPATGAPRIAYYDFTSRSLKYAEYACASQFCAWNTITVDGGIGILVTWTGRYASLKIGSDGVPRIAYFRSGLGFGALRYAARVGTGGNCGAGSWQCDTIDTDTNTGLYPSLDLTSATSPYNVPYIAYYDKSIVGDLRLAWYLGNGTGNCGPSNNWGCKLIDSGDFNPDLGRYPSLRLVKGSSPQDHTGIAYYDVSFDRIKYAYPHGSGNCGGGQWQCDIITSGALAPDPDTVIAVELVADTAYRPHIVYGHRTIFAPSLSIARYVGAFGNCGPTGLLGKMWQCDVTVTDPQKTHDLSQYAGVSVNDTNMMTIAYYDATAGDLMLAQQRTSVFLPLVLR